jgi:hypothetical protein
MDVMVSGLAMSFAPGGAGGVDDGVVVFEDGVGEPVLAQILPDVLDRVELRAREGGKIGAILSGTSSLPVVCLRPGRGRDEPPQRRLRETSSRWSCIAADHLSNRRIQIGVQKLACRVTNSMNVSMLNEYAYDAAHTGIAPY